MDQKCLLHNLIGWSYSIVNVNKDTHSILYEAIHEKHTNMKHEFIFKIKFITLWSPETANVALLDRKCSNMTWPHRLSFSIVFVIMDTHSIGVHETKTNMKLELFFKIKFITLWMPVTANVALLDRKCSKMTWPHRLSFSIVNVNRDTDSNSRDTHSTFYEGVHET